VNWIIFNIKSRKKVFINDGKGDEINMADVASIAATPKTPPSPTPAYSVADIPTEILRWIPETHQSHRGVLRDIIIYTETHGLPYVVQKVAYTTTRKPKDFAAYLGNALKKDLGADFDPRQPPPSPKPSLPVNLLVPMAGSAGDRTLRHRKALAPTGLSTLSVEKKSAAP
jgi:hypothetical protein